jgi:Ca2+-binding EF-hand superfamily protein
MSDNAKMKQIISEVDTNKDGSIDFNEFKKMMKSSN